MAHLVATDAKLYVNEWDVSSHITALGGSLTQDAVEATTMGNTARVYVPGLKSGSISHSGLLDFADDASYEMLSSFSGTAIFSVTPDGDTEGTRALLGQFLRTTWTPAEFSIGDIASFTLSGQPTDIAASGYVLHPKTARTSTSNTTGVQVGALSGGTGYAALHVFSGTASTLDVVIQSDDNAGFTSASNRVTFTQATGATSEWKTVTSAGSDDYWRVSYTVGGGTWTFAVTFGIV